MDPLTISLVALGCSVIIATTNLIMCSIQSYTITKNPSDGQHSENHHITSDDHSKDDSTESNHQMVELTGKVVHPE